MVKYDYISVVEILHLYTYSIVTDLVLSDKAVDTKEIGKLKL